MSDMWQVPGDLADRVRAGDYAEAWRREIQRSAELHRTLTDFIAGMRVAAEMNEGSAHSRYIWAACDKAESRMQAILNTETKGDERR